jgi:hypothetical protein
MLLVFVSGLCAPAARADVSFDLFYSNLSPHGSWLVSAQYGRVWQPAVYRAGWNPYYDGHWVYTDLGWTWVSDYEWGAVPYHYGTWVLDPGIGWAWVPGYVWAPAWVVFRTGPDYIGWAPVSPSFSVGISAGFGEPAAGSFVFVSAGNFVAPRIRSCVVPRDRTTVIINRTTVVNNIRVENNVVVNRGPDVTLVERASHRRIRQERIERVGRVAPLSHVSREQLAVDPGRMKGGLRAAEPVSDKAPLPSGGQERGKGRMKKHGGQVDKGQQGNSGSQPAVRGETASDRQTARPERAVSSDRTLDRSGRNGRSDRFDRNQQGRDERARARAERGSTRGGRPAEGTPSARPSSPSSPTLKGQAARRHQPAPQPTKKKRSHQKPQRPAPGQQQQSRNSSENDN